MRIILLLILIIKNINAQVYTGCVNNKHISLTFDDGPRDNTNNILRVLDLYNIKATFFINAIHIVRNPNRIKLIKRMDTAGHIIGNHGFSHGDMPSLSDFNKLRELYDNELIIREMLNKRPYFYRPPYFSYDDNVLNAIKPFNYITVTSNLDTNDWKATTENDILNTFKTNLINNTVGYITLQHDHILLNNKVLKLMIEYGLQQGYTFVPLDICLNTNMRYYPDNYYSPNLDNGIGI